MIGSKKIACIIPARLDSTRFPRKILAQIRGKPLLQWVWEAAARVQCFDYIAIAVDAEETKQIAQKFGAHCYMTAKTCLSGTDRLVELYKKQHIAADIWVNWQGDEPFIDAAVVQDLLQSCEIGTNDVWTLCKKIQKEEEMHSPHVVKVVRDYQDNALYFSRSSIPHYRDPLPHDEKKLFKHVGMYAFTGDALQKIASFPPCGIEKAEQLEQLRFLYYGLQIKVHETRHEIFGIDIPEHLQRAISLLDNYLNK